MPSEDVFQSLPLESVKERVDSLRIAYDLIAITLCNGDILLGAIGKHWKWDGEIITISFNTKEGKRFGYSHSVDIPTHKIADIQLVPLDENSTPRIAEDDPQLVFMRESGFAKSFGQTEEEISRTPVQDYPNPLATIICEHNLPIITDQELSLSALVERALSQDAIPPEGIYLTNDILLYADWEYFKRQISGAMMVGAGLSIPGVGVNLSKDISPSLNALVLGRLKESLSERIRRSINPEINQDEIIQGCILIPNPTEDTVIEGEKCVVVLCAISDENDNRVTYPILLKLNLLKYPFELLGRINSVLTFYGEILPIPLNIIGGSFSNTMLVRAVAYLETT